MMSAHPAPASRLRVGALGLVAACLFALPPATARSQDAPSKTRIEVPDSVYEEATFRALGSPHVTGYGDEPSIELPELFDTAASLAMILSDGVEAAGGSLSAGRAALTVEGPPEAIQFARVRVAEFARFLAGRADVRVAVVHLPGETGAPDAVAVRAAVANGTATVEWSERLHVRRGEPCARDVTETTTVVADYDVEVAVGASVADPISESVDTGLRLRFQQRPLDAHRTFAVVSLHLSQRPVTQTFAVDAGDVDLLRTPFAALTAPLVLTTGASQVLSLPHPWGGGTLAVVVEALAIDLPERADRTLHLVDLAALTGVAPSADEVRPGFPEEPLAEAEEPEWARESNGAVADWTYRLVDDDAAISLTPSIVLLTSEAVHLPEPHVTRVVRRSWRMSKDVVHALPGYDALDGSLAREAVPALPAAPARTVAVTVSDSVPAQWTLGTWQRVVTDFDVEIATSAAITDPIVESFVDGEWARVDATESGGPVAEWEIAQVIETTIRPLLVRRDIDGKREDVTTDRLQVVRHRRASGRVRVDTQGAAAVRRDGDDYVIEVWDRE